MRLNELPKWVVPAACSAVAFGVGTAVGHVITKKRYLKVVTIEPEVIDPQLALDFDTTDFDRELGKATYTIRKMRDECENIVGAVRDLAILKDIPVGASRENHPSNQRPDPKNIVIEDPKNVRVEVATGGQIVHIFAEKEEYDDWDYDAELKYRAQIPRGTPYMIHRDEYFNDEMGYGASGDQRTFTFYAEDSILTDEKDVPIYNQDARVGELAFGHGSGDPNIVYVRNEKEEEEYEIVLDDGAFQVVVLGERVADDMEHQDLRHSRAPSKFRRDD